MENLFLTFDSMVSAASFVDLSSNVFSWVEEHCKPQVHVCIGHISYTLLIIFCVGCRVWKTWQLAYFRRLWLGPIKSSQEGSTHQISSLLICRTTSDHYCCIWCCPDLARDRWEILCPRRLAREKPPKIFKLNWLTNVFISLCKVTCVFIRNRIYIVYQLFWLRYDIFELLTLDLFF